MADEAILDEKNEDNTKTGKAKIGDMVEIKRGKRKGEKAEVISLRENSVIVELGINKKTGEPIKTVVNHKNYKRMK
ncbi:DUF2187 family protein [Neobacillus dielmonensis]|uniref:DUF2187 family protein n=1 Tax=Neobacillus dielmonensis TaxID=1347369 RepID=UPI000AE0F7D0|nr:DUF2187 family protein [Neobacillus dielmonensis]